MRRRIVETDYRDPNVVDEPAVVHEDHRPILWNPVSGFVSLILLALLIWAIFWGPIGDMFNINGRGNHPVINVPRVRQ